MSIYIKFFLAAIDNFAPVYPAVFVKIQNEITELRTCRPDKAPPIMTRISIHLADILNYSTSQTYKLWDVTVQILSNFARIVCYSGGSSSTFDLTRLKSHVYAFMNDIRYDNHGIHTTRFGGQIGKKEVKLIAAVETLCIILQGQNTTILRQFYSDIYSDACFVDDNDLRAIRDILRP